MSSARVVDSKAREQALAPNKSFIVQAPAGSGKTGLLVQRILQLLSVVERPEAIVAVTFTIKAAAEMRERVVKALEEARQPSVLVRDEFHQRTIDLAKRALLRDRQLAWKLIDDPSRLHIQTIDALCAFLVRQMPLVSESGGIGSVAEEADEFYREAARQALQQLAEANDETKGPELFRRLALHFDNNIAGLESQIAAMLAKRDQWHEAIHLATDETVRDFSTVLTFAETRLRAVFRKYNTVDFTEVTRAAVKALGELESPSDLLYSLDYRIEHLLIDEFQDTSRAQYDLLKSITGQWSDGDGRTLFLVGDPLQSIYGFRAAEVQLFQQCWSRKTLGAVRLVPLRLEANFRSTPEIVNWVQSELASVFGEENQSTGAVKLQVSTAARDAVGITPILTPLLDDASGEQEAMQVAELLRKQKDHSSIAILVRSRSHVLAILGALRKASIPYEAVDIDPLKEQQHVLDLIALTRALYHAADRIAWLACLRAPWCGLTLADLSALAEGGQSRTIIDLLSDPERIRLLSVDGRFRAVATQQILLAATNKAGRLPVRNLVEETWNSLGGPGSLAKNNQREDVERFWELLSSLDEGGIIRDNRALTLRLNKLYAHPENTGECVRVMTIHEAKGLEFDTVILPHLGAGPHGDEQELLVWNETLEEDESRTLEVAAQPRKGDSSPLYDKIREATKQKTRNEGKRLFYVACTRAKNQLYLFGSTKQNKYKTDVCKAASNTFLGLIWDRYKADFQGLQRRMALAKTAVQAGLFEDERAARHIQRVKQIGQRPAFDKSVQWQPEFERGTASDRKISYEWVGGTSRHVGTVVHGVLNRVAREGLQEWPEERLNRISRVVRDELNRLGVEEKARAAAQEQTLRAIRNTIASSRGRWILTAQKEAASEWPLAGKIGKRLISGTIDRLFRDDDGKLWIVDFKTSQHLGGSTVTFLDREHARYRQQMESYAALLSAVKQGPIWMGLYFPLLDGWRAWEWAALAEVAG